MLRIVSYNIHSGRDLFWRRRLDEMAETLTELQADVIGLQEVHENSKYGFQAAYLAERLQCQYIFSPSIAVADGYYGNALLTRIPVHRSVTVNLPAKKEQRSLLQSSLSWHCGFIGVWVTHCSLNQLSRLKQMRLLMNKATDHKDWPLIVLGDFNTTVASFEPVLRDCARVTGKQHLPTLPTFRRRIDYIFTSRHWRILHYELCPVKWSDHVPVIATLELTEPPTPVE
jgi:endonuclease/exonuclease/phosphatase family metal-dependent hydrolase